MKLSELKPIVLVRWGDAWINSCRYYVEGEDFEPVEMRTLGFLMEETDTALVVCSDNTEGGSYRHLVSIPMVNIIEIIHLEVDL